jgi:tetratricopeptide (TPR) repeat protein
MSVAGKTVGIIGALAAFPRRLAAREVERQRGKLRRGVTRRTSLVVFGRRLLERAGDGEIVARVGAVTAAGRTPLSENGFLRLLGLLEAEGAAELSRASLLDQSGLSPRDFDLLALFDAFERDVEPHSFRDLILARKYAGLVAGGAGWHAIARSIHRSGPVASLTALSLQAEARGAIYARRGDGLSELDGQLLLGLEEGSDDPDELFALAEAAEAGGEHAEAAVLYQRCLGLDPGDSVAAFNRANCLRAAGQPDDAVHAYMLAIKRDPGFVEARFNLAGLMRDRGQPDAARRHLSDAIAIDPDYADAIYNLATLDYDAGNLAEARRGWARYLEFDDRSEWARKAARGVRYVDLMLARRTTG